jgi:cytochrome b6-f complex iron-sulfur subunit
MLEIVKALTIAAGFILIVQIAIIAINIAASRRYSGPVAASPSPDRGTDRSRKARLGRRKFLSWVGIGWAAFTSFSAVAVGATGRFMFPNVLFEPPSEFKAGSPKAIRFGEVDERFKSQYGVWLVKDQDPETGRIILYALSDVCTHLGCIPNWLEDEQKFKCPCHGSGYYKSGINFEGPTPRPLERFAISLADDGQILVDKSHKFQQEKGEWADPRSFLTVSAA